jgi:RimJ/RimL family protein N-acetyltransferase
MFYELNSTDEQQQNTPETTIPILNDDVISIFLYSPSRLPYIATHIYPFWKKDFLQRPPAAAAPEYNPYASWSPQDIVRHNMGCKDNTLCVQVLVCDIPVGFCTILLLDQFDYSDKMSAFSHEIYRDSAVLYNFVIDTPFRQQGYAAQMLQTVIAHLQSHYTKQYHHLVLYVDKTNTRAQHLYKQAGFEHVGDNPNQPTSQDMYRKSLLKTTTHNSY